MGGARGARRRQAREAAAIARDTTLTQAQIAGGIVRRALAPAGAVTQTAAPAELRRRVANLAPGTYVDDILAQQDSTLYRWPEHLSDALRVYVEPTSAISGWSPQYPELARAVFDEWSEAGFPIRFAFVYDSAGADISIHWRDRFPPSEGQRVGVTERVQTSRYLISRAAVTIAMHDSAGHLFGPSTVAGILRHEIGHALGLNHAESPGSIMYRESTTLTIGAADRATLRLIYLVPPGTLKER